MVRINAISLLEDNNLNLRTIIVTMRIFRLFAILTAVSAIAFTACTENNQTTDNVDTTTSVTFEKAEVELTYEASEVTLNYTINNGIEGIDIVAETSVEWISNIKANFGTLTFDVERNGEASAREAKIRVVYPNVAASYITVKQAQFDAITFEMEVTSSTSTSCSTLIKPSNNDFAYIAYMSEIDYFLGAGITSAEELFQDDYNYFMGFAE